MPINLMDSKAYGDDKPRENIFARLSPEEKKWIGLIAQRAQAMGVAFIAARKSQGSQLPYIQPVARDIALDISVAHLSRPMNLYAFLLANDLDFFAEYVLITKNLDRTCLRLPPDVPLRYPQRAQ